MVLGIFRSSKSNDEVAEEVTSSSTKAETEQGDRKAFSAYAQQSGLSQPENEWPSSLIVVPSHRAKDVEYQLPIGSAESNEEKEVSIKALPLNGDVVLIDGQHFQGKLVSRVRDVSTTPCQSNLISNNDYFQNRSRQYQWWACC